MDSTGLFKVIRASAGSGKTYSLVKEFLLLSLKTKDAGGYRSVLAVTFTNAAAAEMKERFVRMLHRFSRSGGGSEPMFEEVRSALGIGPEDLQARASAMFRHVLHNYSLLSITTIDSFTHKLIRSFARDLHLSHDFGIEMDTDTFNEMLVAECFEEMNSDAELKTYLVRFAIENLQEENKWNVKNDLQDIAKLLTDEESLEAIRSFENLDLNRIQEIRKKLFESIRDYRQTVKAVADRGVQLIESMNLVPADFKNAGRGYIGRLYACANFEFDLPSSTMLKLSSGGSIVRKDSDESTKQKVSSIEGELIGIFEELNLLLDEEKLGRYHLLHTVRNRIYSIGLLARLKQVAWKLKSEKNILLISDFHQLVGEVVKDSPAPFIYERLGMRFQHILIDEFQDTSALQWSNALPLIVNSLGEGKTSLVVGDAKQSIYRWRGGIPEQFVNLPELDSAKIKHTSGNFLKAHFADQILERNFRSASVIVDINNSLYHHLKACLGEHERVYDKLEQTSIRPVTGYFRNEIIRAESREESRPLLLTGIHNAIVESISDGYDAGDIVVLVRKNKDAAEVAAHLRSQGISVETSESFLLMNSPKVRAITGYMSYLINPKSRRAVVTVIEALAELNSEVTLYDWAISEGDMPSSKKLPDLKNYLTEFYDLTLSEEVWSPFHLAVKLAACFKFEADTYLEFLFDTIRQKIFSGRMSHLRFMEWWNEKADDLNIITTADRHSVKLMTVHKSKGLQFPVVIYPRFSGKDQSGEVWVDLDEEDFGLPRSRFRIGSGHISADLVALKNKHDDLSKLDDTNICYVATTRAEDRLYMMSEIVRDKGTWLTMTLAEIFMTHFKDLQTKDNCWESGLREKFDNSKRADITAETVNWNIPALNREPVKFDSADDDFQSESMIYGEMVHYGLSVFQFTMTPGRLESMLQFNFPDSSKDMIDKALSRITEILRHPSIGSWFSAGVISKSEMDLVDENGKIFRPDKVIFGHEYVDVIEFKTGLPKAFHADQVRTYQRLISTMTALPVRGFLVYTENLKVIEIGEEEA